MAAGGPTDDLLLRTLAAVASEASDQHVEALIARARAEAESEVTALLKKAIKASLLRRALERLERNAPAVAQETAAHEPAPRPRDFTLEELPTSRPTAASMVGATGPDDAPSTERPTEFGCYVYGITRAGPQAWAAATPA